MRQTKLRSLQYWDDFRIRRQRVIERYIQAKKNQRSFEFLLKHLYLDYIFRHISKVLKKVIEDREFEMAWKLIKSKIVLKLRKTQRRYQSL